MYMYLLVCLTLFASFLSLQYVYTCTCTHVVEEIDQFFQLARIALNILHIRMDYMSVQLYKVSHFCKHSAVIMPFN